MEKAEALPALPVRKILKMSKFSEGVGFYLLLFNESKDVREAKNIC